MNYLLKRQASPCVVECFLNNTKQIKIMSCYCHICLRLHPVFCNNVPKLSSSSYVAALQEMKNKEISKSNSKNRNKMLKLIPFKSQKKKILAKSQLQLNKSGEFVLKKKYNANSTKSYDPNLFNYNIEIEKFYKEYLKNEFQYSEIKPDNNDEQKSNFQKTELSDFGSLSCKKVHCEEEAPTHKLLEVNRNDVNTEEVHLCPQNQTLEEAKKIQMFCLAITEHSDFVNFLCSSMDIYYTNDIPIKAFQLLQMCRRKPMWKSILKKNHYSMISIYNPLLQALANKGHWNLLQTVDQWMNQDNVKLDCESLAAHLLCLANLETGKEGLMQKEVSAILDKIFLKNISLNDIFSKTKLNKESYDKILSVIREVVPAFEVEPDVMKLNSDCVLLKNLYAGIKGGLSNQQPYLENWEIAAIDDAVEQQAAMEKNFTIAVKAVSSGREDDALGRRNFRGKEIFTKIALEKLKTEWKDSLREAIVKYQNTTAEKLTKVPLWSDIHLYLNCLPAESMTDILMETTMNIIEYTGGYTPCCDEFYRKLGLTVFDRYQQRKNDITGYTQKTEKLIKKFMSWYFNPSGPTMNSRQKWQMLIQDSEKTSYFESNVVKWPAIVTNKVGKFLLDLLIKNVKYSVQTSSGIQSRPVIYTVLRYRAGIHRLELRCHPSVTEMFERVGFDTLNFRAEEVPMLCPPKPWKSANQGGYLFLNTDFVRKPLTTQGKVLKFNDMPQTQLYAAMDSLNVLQSVPWRINQEVLDVALNVFTSGGSEKLTIPAFPRKLEFPKEPESLNFKSRLQQQLKKRDHAKNYANNYALWCETLYRLSLANHFRNKVFWLPQNFDFRGRMYPVPPMVSYVGSDLFRSLFVFAKEKPLGPKGLDWLKIHLVNLTGTQKKSSIEHRLDFANRILPEILDSAEKPLTGKKWWMESDEPWQTLAACIEVKKALSVSNPESYVSGFPIHQDGSCNGLQHYAALGRDLIGAKSVNLVPCYVPQDVYAVVADLIEKERAKDAANGIEIAKILEGFIERKVIKQTVMTTVYGVTPYGAKLQISRRLEEIPNFPREHIKMAALYLSEKTFSGLRQMFESAKQIQDWLVQCATEICAEGDYVQWISPIGLPVLQFYGKFAINKTTNKRMIVPNELKQKNAFPPNFIHSLDSSHMMLTALYCEQAGLTFSAVHDCFWTHANSVDTMNRICREQFISLHKQSILEDLSVFFQNFYGKRKSKSSEIFKAVPEKGSFDVNEVLKSVYFFS